ncbi:MAG: aromatic acid exporter family protein [Anaerofustis sp.]
MEPAKTKEKTKLPKVGMRIIKTVIAVYLCCVIDILRAQQPFYSMIAAILCMQPDRETSLKTGLNRTVGTLIGGVYGIIPLLLDNWLHLQNAPYLYYLILSLFLIPLIYTAVMVKKSTAAYITCVVFLSITVSHITDVNPYLFAANRMLDTLIGIGVSLLVNIVLPGAKKVQKET